MPRLFAITIGVAAAYWAASHLVAVFFSAFGMLPAPTWPAASIALSAAVLAGRAAAPGIALGTVLANAVSLGAPVDVSLGIAVMNTAAPLLAAALIRRMAPAGPPFATVRYVLAFIVFGLMMHPALTATGGVVSLMAGGRLPLALLDAAWRKWWLAHASGAMLLTPALLCWWSRPRLGLDGRQLAEAVLVSILAVTVAAVTFSAGHDAAHEHYGMTFVLFAPVAWVAVRFGARDVAGLLPIVAVIAATGTLNGLGPFHDGGGYHAVAALGMMLMSLSLTALLVAALAEERRGLEANLREQHAYANALVDNAGALTVVLDRDGNLIRFNQACRRLTGYDESEVLGRLYWERLILADERPGVEAALRGLQAGFSPIHHENHLLTRDHGPRLIAWENTLVRDPDGRVRFIIGNGQDVTDQRWVEEEMRKLAMVAARTSNAVIITDAEGRTEWVNEGFTRLSGYRPDEVIGRTPGEMLQGPDSDPAAILRMRERLRAGEGFREEILNYARDGRPYWIDIDVQPVVGRDGRVERFIGIESDVTERKRAEDAQRRLLQIIETARDIVASADGDGRLTYMNAAGRALLGIGADEDISHLRAADTHSPEGAALVMNEALPVARRHGFWEGENEFLTRDGQRVPVWQVIVAHTNPDGGVKHYSTIARDIRQRRRDEAELRLAASVYHNTIEGIVITDPNGIILSVNPAFTEITGFSADEAVGATPRILKSDHHDEAFYAAMWRELKATGRWKGELWNRRKSGEVFLEHQTITMVPDAEGNPVRYVAVFNDITELRRKDERIRHLAYHDPLTHLPNRQLLQDRLEHALALCRREGKTLAVMFLDLDRFKVINDTLGHDVGDNLLREVANRLVESVRGTDTVARLGGDEFVVVVEHPATASSAAAVAEKIIRRLAAPIDLGRHQIHVTTSIGIGMFPGDGDDLTELMKNADTAMYAAKAGGRNTYHFFSAAMNEKAHWRLELENEMRRAVERGEFQLHYQPKVELATGRPVGAEALIRWNHPTKGIIPPSDFIPMAEETGMIVEMGEWAILEACGQMRRWLDEGLPPMTVAVNVSTRQLTAPGLFSIVSAALEVNDLPATALELEVTESGVMDQADRAIAMLEGLKTLGISIAVDDFGTGYSSLSYLRKLPIDTVKIDRSFVMDLETNEQDFAIVRTILAMAQILRLGVVAEGVETAAQAAMLTEARCEMAQGFLYARPLPAADFAGWLRASANAETAPA